ncbi:DUF2196 domain containing protein [Pyrenophora tritici-repentis]|uniref:DUF2196 domain containing protein n=1 Tax=Pyrenophora tritici-repentis TaxID=45151 RepID=A0A922NPV0_9PLEO|nr:DUF2196 domain containing protein [Pyrenophora tritici-repentis]KAI1675461.1 DUF2196 domain containing protein [Pyrenophora tritici-repentis]KAI1687379.1 DUF2196 domain containing protein [Pyrenophora tritici-repentis]
MQGQGRGRSRENIGPISNNLSSSSPSSAPSRGRGRGANTPAPNQTRGRGGPGFRARGRGRVRTPNIPRDPDHPRVPAYSSISRGTAVSIILKQDQPTGHQVKGIVADLLTRGDHPRGVKVRLRDGRVGRVQGLVAEAEGIRGEALVGGVGAGLGRNGEGGGGMRGGRVERDIRDEDDYLYDEGKRRGAGELGLFAALEEADRRHAQSGSTSGGAGQMATCPVCRVFEGDEAAVAHHVEEHFGE